jgi:putative phosphoribosyl transferase
VEAAATQRYRDRQEAGHILGREVKRAIAGWPLPRALVLGLPRGGVPVARQVALALGLPLDLFLVRKLGVPQQPELAFGAIASGGIRVLNSEVLDEAGLSEREIEEVAAAESAELDRRERIYRTGSPAPDVRGRAIIVVDDGLATGSTMRAAIAALKQAGAGPLIVAVPVGAPSTCAEVGQEVERLICPLQPDPFQAVGLWYEKFAPTSDEEVRGCLEAGRSAL